MPRPIYDRHSLVLFDGVENFDAVVERIDLAASKANILMRAIGMSLPTGDQIPTLDETDDHLRRLTAAAYVDLLDQLQAPIAETEGYAVNDLFEVTVIALEPYDGRRIRVEISMALA